MLPSALPRMSTMPIVAVLASSLALAPVIVSPTPHALAAELTSSSKRIVRSAGEAIGDAAAGIETGIDWASVTAVGLLGASPNLLRSVDVHDLATFVALPQASVPLFPNARSHAASTNTGSNPAGNSVSIAAADPAANSVSIAATDPVADLLAALQAIGGTVADAFIGAPTKIVQAIGLALDGNVREALGTLTGLILEPIVNIGFSQLPQVGEALAGIFPPLAPVFKALPDAVISVGLPLIQGVLDISDTISGAYEGLRDGLKKGDLVAAIGGLLQGAATGIATGLTHFFGEQGFVAGLSAAGTTILKAIGEALGLPATPSSLAASSKLASASSDAVKTDKGVAGSTRSVAPGAPTGGTDVSAGAGGKANAGLSVGSTASESPATASGAVGSGATGEATPTSGTAGKVAPVTGTAPGAVSSSDNAGGTSGSSTAGGSSASGTAVGSTSGSGAGSGATGGTHTGSANAGGTSGSSTAGGSGSGAGSGATGGTHTGSANAGGTSGSSTAGGSGAGSGTSSGATGGKHAGSTSSGSGGAGSASSGSSNSGGKAAKSSTSAGAHGGTNGGSSHGTSKAGGAS